MNQKKVGLIFGCFDLFHIGHLNALKRAVECCDMLFIGVFTDRIIQSYKKALPIIPENDRLIIIEHLNLNRTCKIFAYLVDRRKPENWVTDYFFVSEELRGKSLAMLNIKTYKGIIIYLPYTKGISTCRIRHKVLKESVGRIL